MLQWIYHQAKVIKNGQIFRRARRLPAFFCPAVKHVQWMNVNSLEQSESSCGWYDGGQRNILLSRNTHIRECTVTSCDVRGRGRSRDNPPLIINAIYHTRTYSAYSLQFRRLMVNYPLIQSNATIFNQQSQAPGIRPFSATIFATTSHRQSYFRRLRHI